MMKPQENEIVRKIIDLFGTQNDLAKKLGVPKQNISGWYTGRLSMPLKYIMRLERVYELKIEDLKEGKILAKQLVDNETQRMRENE